MRLLGRIAIRRVLAVAGMPAELLPALSEVRITSDSFGRPIVGLPVRAAVWISSSGLGLDLSLSHAGQRLLAVALAAP